VKIERYDILFMGLFFFLFVRGMRLAKLSELDLFGGQQTHKGAKYDGVCASITSSRHSSPPYVL
jgi:hypothetical protein